MNNRKRGRPKGTQIDDSDVLEKIAELILLQPKLRPTTAIKKLGIYDESQLHRVRGKWKIRGAELLAETRAKKEKASRPATYSSISSASHFVRDDEMTSTRALELALFGADSFCKFQRLGARANPFAQVEKALGLDRSYLDVIKQVQNVMGNVEQAGVSKLIEAGVSSVDKLAGVGNPYGVCGLDLSREAGGTARLLDLAFDTYNLSRKYG